MKWERFQGGYKFGRAQQQFSHQSRGTLYTEIGYNVGPGLRESCLDVRREFTQPRDHSFAQPCICSLTRSPQLTCQVFCDVHADVQPGQVRPWGGRPCGHGEHRPLCHCLGRLLQQRHRQILQGRDSTHFRNIPKIMTKPFKKTQGDLTGCRTGNIGKLSNSQVDGLTWPNQEISFAYHLIFKIIL